MPQQTHPPLPKAAPRSAAFSLQPSAFSLPSSAFTLVEMIVVTGIIALLAALIFPVGAAVKKAQNLKRAQTELMAVAHAIDGYKDKLGHFPPDNPSNPLHSQLYYELRGTTAVMTQVGSVDVVTAFQLPDGQPNISTNEVATTFGVGGFINCTRPGAGDEAQPAQKFLPELKGNQYTDISTNGVTFRVLGCSLDGPNAVTDPATGRKFSPWWYNYSNPTNGTAPYDLFVEIRVGSKVYRVSNWSTTPQVVQ